MGVFDRFTKNNNGNQEQGSTTRGFCIGVPEAEAEATSSAIKLDLFFEDYLNVFNELNNQKFIVLGRKGTGKTALGEYMYNLSNNNPNFFCTFIKKQDIDIERIVQIGKDENITIERALLCKWIILTKFVALFTDNEILSQEKGMKHLRQFIKNNRGFVNIGNLEIKEIVRTSGIDVNIEYFKRFLSARGYDSRQYKSEKAEFYKLIPDLERVVVDILKSDQDNNYLLLFDDLDIGLDLNNNDSVNTLADLIRTVKGYNNDIFSRNSIESKIIIFLRTDIQKRLIYTADMPKLFSSYAIELKWYDDLYRNDELKIRLRKFINKRISINFENKKIPLYNKEDAWTSFVAEKNIEQNGRTITLFKYIIDHTFFRPRDLILFFNDIGSLDLAIPITYDIIDNVLMERYTQAMIEDIKGELSINYDKYTIDVIFRALYICYTKRPFTYNNLNDALQQQGISKNRYKVADIISDLYDYSLIGNLERDGKVWFRFRDTQGQRAMDKKEKFILHFLLEAYFKRNPSLC